MKKDKTTYYYMHFMNSKFEDKSTWYTYQEILDYIDDEELEFVECKTKEELVQYYLEDNIYIEITDEMLETRKTAIETIIRYYKQGCNYHSQIYTYCLTLTQALTEVAKWCGCKVNELWVGETLLCEIAIHYKGIAAILEFRMKKDNIPVIGITDEELKKCKQYKYK